MNHQVITNVMCWSVIALLKEYVFLTVAVSVLAVYSALKVYQRCCVPRKNNVNDVEGKQVDDVKPEGLTNDPIMEVNAETVEDYLLQDYFQATIGEERNEMEVIRSPQNTNSGKKQLERRTLATLPEAKQTQGLLD